MSRNTEKHLTYIIVEDETPARKRLLSLLDQIPEQLECLGEASNGKEALKLMKELENYPDILFLDIEMPLINGFDLLDMLPGPRPNIIFITAYDEYAIKAFEEQAVDYLLKPVRTKRLAESIRRVKDKVKSTNYSSSKGKEEEETHKLEKLIQQQRSSTFKRLPVHHRQEILLLPLEDILYIESDGTLCNVYSREGTYWSDHKMDKLDERLTSQEFIRIHRSYLVNRNHISKLIPWFKGTYRIKLSNGSELDVARRRTHHLKELLGMK